MRLSRIRFGPGFHTWVQTVSTFVQAVAVVLGVGFAIWQINDAMFSREQERSETTLAMLSELRKEPVKSAVEFIERRITGNSVWDGPTISLVEFLRRVDPLTSYLQRLSDCVLANLCDRKQLELSICPLSTHFTLAFQKVEIAEASAKEFPLVVSYAYFSLLCPGWQHGWEDIQKLVDAARERAKGGSQP
jgi:hypothetical protein